MTTDPTNPDTDGDGLLDGEEIDQTISWKRVINDTGNGSHGAYCIYFNMLSDPTKVDTDGDGSQTLNFEYSIDNSQTLYYLESTATDINDVIGVTAIFDRYGTVTSEYSSKLDKSEVYANVSYEYAAHKSSTLGNKIAVAASSGKATHNLLLTGSDEISSSASYANSLFDEYCTLSVQNVEKQYNGYGAVKMTISDDAEISSTSFLDMRQSVSLPLVHIQCRQW